MKYISILTIILLNSAFGLTQRAEFNFINGPVHEFEKTHEGIQLKHYFVFENTGEEPLIIDKALVSCECTKIYLPEKPVLPQQKDSILVTFDTKDKYYQQDRVIKLISNTRKKQKLRFRVYVIPEED